MGSTRDVVAYVVIPAACGLVSLAPGTATILTMLTLGLYRPFAVVNVYRFRLQHVSVKAASFEQLLATQQVPAAQTGKSGQVGQASGDSTADLFGFDLSW